VKTGEKTFWAYGGDFGPLNIASDDNFCCNGLVTPDANRIRAVRGETFLPVHPLQMTDAATRTVEVKTGSTSPTSKTSRLARGNSRRTAKKFRAAYWEIWTSPRVRRN